MKKFLFVFMFFVPAMIFAAIGDNGISYAPDGTLLKWDAGKHDFFIMHKTLINRVTGEANLSGGTDTTEKNPQADTFLDHSTYTLTLKHIPQDADIEKAFLVWFSTQDPDNLSGSTDNSVTLSFTNSTDSSITLTKPITASLHGNIAQSTVGNFEYEALNISISNSNIGVFTYRVEISNFMKEIISMGKAKGMKSGEALYGKYTVSDMDGSNHKNYIETGGLVGGWFIPFVYTSEKISAKNIYFYNGLEAFNFGARILTVSDFELPNAPLIKLGLVVFEGDTGLANTTAPNMTPAQPEGLYISSQSNPTDFVPLFNECNPSAYVTSTTSLNYVEVYNSISSVFGWENPENYWCVGGNPEHPWPIDASNPLEYAMDADIFMVDASPNGAFYGRFNKGDSHFNIQIGANQDQIYTNMLIVSVSSSIYCTSDSDCKNGNKCLNNECVADSSDSGSNDNSNTDSSDSGSSDNSNTDPADSDNNSGDGSAVKPEQGELGGECYPNNTCNSGLTCYDNTCIKQASGNNDYYIPKRSDSSDGCSVLTID